MSNQSKISAHLKRRLAIFSVEFDTSVPGNDELFAVPFQRVTPAQFEAFLGIQLDENGDPPLTWEDQREE